VEKLGAAEQPGSCQAGTTDSEASGTPQKPLYPSLAALLESLYANVESEFALKEILQKRDTFARAVHRAGVSDVLGG
jgi:hypothetical protein